MSGYAVTRIRVVAADDSYVIREFIKSVLGSAPGIDLVAVCSTATELELAIETGSPDVVWSAPVWC
jgi:chemotaxis response regulator CheB